MYVSSCFNWLSPGFAANIGTVSGLEISSSAAGSRYTSWCGIFCLNGKVSTGGIVCTFPILDSVLARVGCNKLLLVHLIFDKKWLFMYILLGRKNRVGMGLGDDKRLC